MQTGTYKTTDPNKRIRVVFDENYPTDNPDFPFAGGVLEDLQKCYDDYDYFGVIVEQEAQLFGHQLTPGLSETFWEETDSVWSCAGYGDNVAEEVAKEYFGITVTGKI